MTNTNTSFFEKAYDPFVQAGVVLGMGLVVMLGGKLVAMIDLLSVSERFPWMTAAAFILFFAMFNSIFSLSSSNMNKYWGRSMMSYAGVSFRIRLISLFVFLNSNQRSRFV